jgi:hypothetical protein
MPPLPIQNVSFKFKVLCELPRMEIRLGRYSTIVWTLVQSLSVPNNNESGRELRESNEVTQRRTSLTRTHKQNRGIDAHTI